MVGPSAVDNGRLLPSGNAKRIRLDWRSTWGPLRWTLILVAAMGLAAIIFWNWSMLLNLWGWWQIGFPKIDWANIASLPQNPYANEAFRWSPPAAWIWSSGIVPLGIGLWRLLHLLALVTLPWPVALLALVSAPFWYDVANGNLMVFVLVAGWHGLNGNRLGIIGFVGLALLVPRPLMLPVLAILLWRSPLARWTFLAAAPVVLSWSLATGLLDDFLARLLFAGAGEMFTDSNIGPSQILGYVWLPLGLGLAVGFTLKGWLGLASLAAQPYWFPYYLLMLLLELRRWPRPHRARAP